MAILGLGAIAEHMARCFKALGMTVYGISRTDRPVEGIDKVFSRDQITEAVAEVDFLVALVPYGPDTDKIIDKDVFDAMKPTACFINVARGGVVDEVALIDALRSGSIAAAGLMFSMSRRCRKTIHSGKWKTSLSRPLPAGEAICMRNAF